MLFNELSEDSRRYLLQLHQDTNGRPSAQVSMYDIGSKIELDRNAASRIAEDLISMELIEIRTLAGGIGITEAALAMLEAAGIGESENLPEHATLGDEPVIGEAARTTVEQLTAELKNELGKLGLSYEDLAELMTDLKTVDIQMGSSSPKTAIVRECFRSMKDSLEKAGATDAAARIENLL